MDNFDLRKYLAEGRLLKEDTSLTMNQLEKLANIKSDEFKSSPDKLVDMVMGSVKFNLEKDGTNIENASEDEIDKLRYKWARLKGLLKVKDTFTSMYGKRGVKTNTDKDLLDKILRENKLVKEEQESITIDSKVDFETPLKTLEDSEAEPNLEEADAIQEFIDFINRKYPNLSYKQINLYKGNLLRDATEEFEEEVETPYTTQSAVNSYIDEVYGFIRELNLDFPEELDEIDMTISSEAVESSVKQGLNQMFERLADIVDNKEDIQSETLGVTNYIKRLMREYAKYADMDRRDSIEGGNKFSKQGKEEARQEIERILSRK